MSLHPYIKEVTELALPALGSLLADPLMSLIDTAAVGQYGSLELAALGPNTAVFQVVFQLFSFLSITTTGMVARASADGNSEVVRRALANSIILALFFGGITATMFQLFSTPVLAAMGATPDLVEAAVPYLRIRGKAVQVDIRLTLGVERHLACQPVESSSLSKFWFQM